MSIIIDAVIVLLVVLFIFDGKKKGFARTAIELLGWIAVAVLAIPVSQAVSNWIYDVFISNAVRESVNASIADTSFSGIGVALNEFMNNLPEFISDGILNQGISIEEIVGKVETHENIANIVSDVIKPVICPLISAFISIIITIVGMFLVHWLAKICGGFINKIPIVSGINALFGAIAGAAKGIVICIIVAAIVSNVVATQPDGFIGITSKTINNSYIFKLL